MSTMADIIAEFIQQELSETKGYLELRRKELAERFNCVPSQITYVLKTRFSPSNGYHVISIRGGGGHIRIIEREIDGNIYKRIGDEVTEKTARILIRNLEERDIITNREAQLLRTVISDSVLGYSGEKANIIRSKVLKSVVSTILT